MRRGRRRQHDIFDQPWVSIAAVIGVIIVIAAAVFFFMGMGDSGDQGATPSTSSAGSTPSVSGTLSTGIDYTQIKELPTVTVPVQGTFVKVSYLGSFSGEYGMEGGMEPARDSGERVYEIENANRTVTAVFKKLDSSTKHDLTVEIWKDGKVMKFESNSSPYGEVSIDYTP